MSKKVLNFFLTLFILIKASLSWTPESLYENYTTEMQYETSTLNKTILTKIIDPNGYVKNKEELYEKIVIIEQNHNLSFLLVVIDEMDDPYLSWFTPKKKIDRIKVFADEFEQLYYQNNLTLLDYSMTVLFAIKDRKMRINSGKIARNEFSGYGRQRLLDNIKSELRKKNYNKAFNLIINNIADYKNFMYRHYFLIIVIIAILFAFFCIGTWVGIKRDKEKNFANSKISKINNMVIELHKGDKNINAVVNENCVICLENFDKNGREEGLNTPLLNLSEETQIINLNCGHKFHVGCLNKWKGFEKECPLCLEKIRDNDSPQEFSAKVYNIQRTCHPNLRAEKINMNGGILSLAE